ncbi:MAG: DUF1566 domain-containing protein [Desulfobulbaceae bacterium]|nr:DUF1566 domain-containing protein [Desulfobulbaceae bacterium]
MKNKFLTELVSGFLKLLIAVFIVCGSTLSAHALLLDRGDGLIYDTDLNVTWLQDLNYAMTSGYDTDGLMNWNQANTWAGDLNFAGFDDWRLPTFDHNNPRPVTSTSANEIGSLVWILQGSPAIWGTTTDYSPFTNIQDTPIYWTGEVDALSSSNAWNYYLDCG